MKEVFEALASCRLYHSMIVIKEIDDGKDKPRRIIPKGGVSDKSENQVTIKSLPGRSPDYGDGIMMRMYFEVVREPEPMMR